MKKLISLPSEQEHSVHQSFKSADTTSIGVPKDMNLSQTISKKRSNDELEVDTNRYEIIENINNNIERPSKRINYISENKNQKYPSNSYRTVNDYVFFTNLEKVDNDMLGKLNKMIFKK